MAFTLLDAAADAPTLSSRKRYDEARLRCAASLLYSYFSMLRANIFILNIAR